jgi:hypothetical protein
MGISPENGKNVKGILSWFRRFFFTVSMIVLSTVVASFPAEIQVNTNTEGEQRSPSVAVDANGNFVVTWMGVGQDGWDIYARRYDNQSDPLGAEFRVNTYTAGNQSSPSVAMDGAGNFMIAWVSDGQAGGDDGVYAQRYDTAGNPVGVEFRVNSDDLNEQNLPKVAVGGDGEQYAIVWRDTWDGNQSGIESRPYSTEWEAMFGLDDRVNTYTIGHQKTPSVAMSANGQYVVVWESQDQDGSAYGIYAQRYGLSGPRGAEFRVNTETSGNQTRPSVGIDSSGNYVIVWASYSQDSGDDIHAQRYDSAGNPVGVEFRVNTYTIGMQSNPCVAMDSRGNFAIVWESEGQDGGGSSTWGDRGVYAQLYDRNGVPVGAEHPVNTYIAGYQGFPAVGMNAKGQYVISWMSEGQDGSGQGIYMRAYAISQPENQPPALAPIGDKIVKEGELLQFSVTATDPEGDAVTCSVDNLPVGASFNAETGMFTWVPSYDQAGSYPDVTFTATDNWNPPLANSEVIAITVSESNEKPVFNPIGNKVVNVGVLLEFTISATDPDGGMLTFTANNLPVGAAFNPATRTFTWIPAITQVGAFIGVLFTVTDDGEPPASSSEVITIVVMDSSWSPAEIQVNTNTEGEQRSPSVAVDANGNFVVTWMGVGQDGWDIYARRYDNQSDPLGAEFRVNTYTAGNQSSPSVAMDGAGNFMIAWVSDGQAGGDDGVYAQRYDTAGNPVGVEFRVNSDDLNEQNLPKVAVGGDGEQYAIVWRDTWDGNQSGIESRPYSTEWEAMFGLDDRVNTYTIGHQKTPSVAMSANGQYVVVWESQDQDGSAYGIYAQRYGLSGPRGAEFRVNTETSGNQTRPSVGIDSSGNYVIVWASYSQDSGDDIHAQRYDSAGNPVGVEFRVNTYTIGMQSNPCVAMDSRGNFAIVWESEGQDGGGSSTWGDRGVYAQLYDRNGVPVGAEHPVNTYIAGYQGFPAVGMNAKGQYVISWMSEGQDGSGQGIYMRAYAISQPENQPPALAPIGDKIVKEGELLQFSVTATDPEGDAVTCSVDNLPVGASFNAETGMFTWVPSYDQAGSYPDVTFTATDSATPSACASERITIIVNNQNRPPVLEPIGDKVVNEGVVLQFTIMATDPDGDIVALSATNLPIGSFFESNTGTFFWVPDYYQAGSYTDVIFTATDSATPSMSASEGLTIIVGDVNRPPVFEPIGDRIVNEGTVLTFTIAAIDPDGNALVYSAGNLPGEATFDASTGTFMWEPDYGQAGNYFDVIFTATDNGIPPLSDSEKISINVTRANSTPILASIGNKSINEGELLLFSISATDPDGDGVVYTVSNLPAGATFVEDTGTFNWVPEHGQAGNYLHVLFTATDNGTPPMSTSESIVITVNNVNRPPVLDPIGDKTIEEGRTLVIVLTASDPDNDALTFSASNLPDGAIFDPNTQTFFWPTTYDQSGNYPNVRFTVVDDGTPLVSVSEAITITVGNVNRPPVLDPIGNKVVSEGLSLEFTITASDSDGDTLIYTTTNLPDGASFDQASQKFVWLPSYDQGGRSYSNIEFAVTDNGSPAELDVEIIEISVGNINRAPSFTPLGTQSIAENELIEFNVGATDPDGDAFTYSIDKLPRGASFYVNRGFFSWRPDSTQAGTYRITFVATDDGFPAMTGQLEVIIIVGDVLSPCELASDLIQEVVGLKMHSSIENSYLAHLKKICLFVESGKATPAINQLEAFIKKVNIDISQNKIPIIKGDELIEKAKGLIYVISNKTS